ncbi:MAG: extracellular solute-binding protein, partial [Chloroflexota bacterium]
MMKKMLSVLLMALIAVIGAIPFAAQDGESLVMWAQYDLTDEEDPNAVTLSAKIAEFEEATGIEIVYEQIAWDQLAPLLSIAVTSGGDVPDLVEAGSQHIPALLDAGALMPLDDLLAESEFVAGLGAGDANACVVDDVRYCVATNVRGGMTYYSADVFMDGYPQTVEEWLAVAPELSGDGSFFSTQFASGQAGVEIMWWPMIASNGGSIFDAEGQPNWATEEVVEVIEFGRTIFNEGYFPEVNITGDFADAEAPWIDGDSASFRGGSWSAIFIPGLQDSVDSGDVIMTGGVDFGGGNYVFMVSESWVVPSGAENAEASAMWLE